MDIQLLNTERYLPQDLRIRRSKSTEEMNGLLLQNVPKQYAYHYDHYGTTFETTCQKVKTSMLHSKRWMKED